MQSIAGKLQVGKGWVRVSQEFQEGEKGVGTYQKPEKWSISCPISNQDVTVMSDFGSPNVNLSPLGNQEEHSVLREKDINVKAFLAH